MKEVCKTALICGFLMIFSQLYAQQNVKDTLDLPNYLSFDILEYRGDSRQSILYNTGYKANELPIFCKMEHQLQIQSRFPVRIRLGDVSYVNKLESKN